MRCPIALSRRSSLCSNDHSNQGMNGLNFMPALEPNPDNKETLNTTVTSGKGDVETKSSIMELFDSKKQLQRQSLPLRSNVQPEIGATPLRVGGPPHVWNSSMKTAPPSATTGKGSRSGTANGSLGGAERYGYLSFSEVQVGSTQQCKRRVLTPT